MITRRSLIVSFFIFGFARLVHGKNQNASSNKGLLFKNVDLISSQVHDIYNFFSYACSHCNRFHPETEKLRQALKTKGHEMIDVPVMLDPSHVILSQTYFAFERLDRLKDLHEEFWHWLLFAEHKWTTTEDVNKDIIAWVKDKGIAEETWVTALHHKDTLAKVEWAQKLAADYQLDGTPAIGVNGKYLTSPSMAGSNEKCIELVLELADKK